MKKRIPAIIAIVLIIIITAGAFGMRFLKRYTYSQERADLNSYYGLASEEETAVILNQEMLEEKGKMVDGSCYLSFDMVHALLNDRFYADMNEKLLLYTLPEGTVKAAFDVPGEDGSVPARLLDGSVYILADYVKQFTDLNFTVFTEPNRIQIDTDFGSRQTAVVKKDTAVRRKGGIKSEILTDIQKGDKLIVLEEMENWIRVKTDDSFIGYVERKRLEEIQEETPEKNTGFTPQEYAEIRREKPISLAWHQVTSQSANDTFPAVMNEVRGVNVISPTWFFLYDNNGVFECIAEQDYVDKAHEMGLEVWALLDNFTYDVDIREVLSYTSKREMLIKNLVSTALDYKIDGINVDFENVPSAAGEDYIQFIRELSIACHENGLVLSVDNYVPLGHNAHYRWREQGVFADYVIIMGYDEHWGGSEEAGSVASIGFVETGIRKMTELVPKEKIINAVPFYTRIWKTAGAQIQSEAAGIAAAEAFLKNNNAEVVWDEETCQKYAEFESEGVFYQVWLEEEQSLEAKINVMKKYDIAGVAVWKLGLEKGRPEVWDVLAGFAQ